MLVKDDQIAAAGSLAEGAPASLRTRSSRLVRIEVEVDTLRQPSDLLRFPLNTMLLDDIDVETLKPTVEAGVARRITTEESDGVGFKTIREMRSKQH